MMCPELQCNSYREYEKWFTGEQAVSDLNAIEESSSCFGQYNPVYFRRLREKR